MPAFLTLQAVSAATPDGTSLFSDLTLTFYRERTGIVGPNGCGKSTLLQIMSGERDASAGAISRAGSVSILKQAWPDLDISVSAAMGVSDQLERLSRIEAGQGEGEDFATVDWLLPAHLDECLTRAGLDGRCLGQRLGELSGGQRTRVGIAKMLLEAPNLLVLDEPTNNLDAEGRALILDLISHWQGGVAVVSHDRELLSHVDRILSISQSGCYLFGGGWPEFEADQLARTERLEAEQARAEREVKRVQLQIQQHKERKARRDKMGRAQRKRGDQPKMLLDAQEERADKTSSKDSQLAKRLKDASDKALSLASSRLDIRPPIAMDVADGTKHGEIVTLDQITFERGECRLGPISARIERGDRIALVGPNGSGKSTLMALIIGSLKPAHGWIASEGKVAVLDQHSSAFEGADRLIDLMRIQCPSLGEQDIRALLARYGFRNIAAEKPAGSLSGGERLRAGLATAFADQPDLLILDEPTNHLDLDTITILEESLNRYSGALLVASHDPVFLDAIGIQRHWTLSDGLIHQTP